MLVVRPMTPCPWLQGTDELLLLAKRDAARLDAECDKLREELVNVRIAREGHMNALIYDIEIKRAIPPRDGPLELGIQYCAGWHDHANMGISVIGAYDYAIGRYRVFCDDNKAEFFEAMESADLLVSFNGLGFDDKVIRACWFSAFHPGAKSYDLLNEIWHAAGLEPTFNYHTHSGYGLDAMCEANFGRRKTGNGALAPVLWQQGKIGATIGYCLNDITLTKMLFDRALLGEPLVSPKDGSTLRLTAPPCR